MRFAVGGCCGQQVCASAGLAQKGASRRKLFLLWTLQVWHRDSARLHQRRWDHGTRGCSPPAQLCRALHPRESALLINAAAKSSMPDWDRELPKFRVIPSRKPGGNLRMVWSKKGQPIGCQIEYAGIPEAEAEAMRRHARKVYSAWWKAMRTVRCRLLFERRLTKWRIVGLGAPCEPWTQGGNKSPYKAGAWQ
jgi:hypothetical protein